MQRLGRIGILGSEAKVRPERGRARRDGCNYFSHCDQGPSPRSNAKIPSGPASVSKPVETKKACTLLCGPLVLYVALELLSDDVELEGGLDLLVDLDGGFVFTKFLILNQMKETFSHIMRKGTEAYNVDNYTTTPVIFDGMIAKFAMPAAEKLVDNEIIELQITDGDRVFYHTVNIDNPEHEMTEIFDGFKEYYTTGQFSALIENLVKDINFLEPDLLRQKYQTAIKELKEELNKKWMAAGKKEKEVIGDILRVVNERLNTVDKFLSKKYQV